MELFELNKDNLHTTVEEFGKLIDKKGIIIDKETKEPVKCRYTSEILTVKNLGGVLPGSEIFISDTDTAYAGYVMEFLSGMVS